MLSMSSGKAGKRFEEVDCSEEGGVVLKSEVVSIEALIALSIRYRDREESEDSSAQSDVMNSGCGAWIRLVIRPGSGFQMLYLIAVKYI